MKETKGVAMKDIIIWSILFIASCFNLFFGIHWYTVAFALVILSYLLQTIFWFKDLNKFNGD